MGNKKIITLLAALLLISYSYSQSSFIKYSGENEIKFYQSDELLINETTIVNKSANTFSKNLSAPIIYVANNNRDFNVPIILFPNDSIILFDNKNEFQFQSLKSDIRNNELECTNLLYKKFGSFVYEDFYDLDRIPFVDKKYSDTYINRDKEYFKTFGKHLPKPPKNNGERDSLIYNIYQSRINIIEEFKKKKEISKSYYGFINKYLLYRYLYLSIKGFTYSIDKNLPRRLDSIFSAKNILDDSYVQNINTYRAFIYFYNNYLITIKLNRKATDLDAIQNAVKDFTGKTKDRLLMGIVYEQLIKNKVDEQVSNVFFISCENKKYIERINSLLSLRTNKSSGEGEIINAKGQKNKLLNIIAPQKNLILIDFWANWCQPCLNEMKSYLKLKSIFNNKKVDFIFISMDTDNEAWLNAASNYKKIISENYSYLLLGNFNSIFAKNYNIKTIPRYMIIGKDGKIYNADAPRPSDPKLKLLLDKLLNE